MRVLAVALCLLCVAGESWAQQATRIAVVYSAATGRVRWIMVAPTDAELTKAKPGPGEARLLLPRETGDLHAVQAAVSDATGLAPTDDRFAIVDDQDKVVGVLHADPDGCGDRVPGLRLIPTAAAGIGWTHSVGQFIAPPVEPPKNPWPFPIEPPIVSPVQP